MARFDKELYEKVRASGVQKRVTGAAENLRLVVSEFKTAGPHGERAPKLQATQRSGAAKKGTRAPKLQATQRGRAAKMGARMRAKMR